MTLYTATVKLDFNDKKQRDLYTHKVFIGKSKEHIIEQANLVGTNVELVSDLTKLSSDWQITE